MSFVPHQYGVHWWINIFGKLKNDSYPLDELYILVTLDSMNGKNTKSVLPVKNILQYFVDMKHIVVQHVKLPAPSHPPTLPLSGRVESHHADSAC